MCQVDQNGHQEELSEEQIAQCIATLELLNKNTHQIFEIAEEQRIALLKAAGLLSRPSREEFARRKKTLRKLKSGSWLSGISTPEMELELGVPEKPPSLLLLAC